MEGNPPSRADIAQLLTIILLNNWLPTSSHYPDSANMCYIPWKLSPTPVT